MFDVVPSILPTTYHIVATPPDAPVDTGAGRLPSAFTALENTPGLPDLFSRQIPILQETFARLPQREVVRLAGTCRLMRGAMEPFRRDAKELYESAAIGDEASVRRLLAKGVPSDWHFDTHVGGEIVRDTALTVAVRNMEADIVKTIVQSQSFRPDDPASATALRMAIPQFQYASDPYTAFACDSLLEQLSESSESSRLGDSFYSAWRGAVHEARMVSASMVALLLAHGVPATSLSDRELSECWRWVSPQGDSFAYLLWHPEACIRIPESVNDVDALRTELKDEHLQVQDLEGRTVLHWCAMYLSPRNHREVLEDVFRRANINVPDHEGRTPLHYAARHVQSETTEFLLSHGADPNRPDIHERTPLHDAAEAGNRCATWNLLFHGADPDLCDVNGDMPSERAIVQEWLQRNRAQDALP